MFNVAYLKLLRVKELKKITPLLPSGARILELGAGTGDQAKLLSEQGFEVIALDLPASDYASTRVFPITDYDGTQIPLPSRSIDVIFSSNVLEHVEDLPTTFAEFRRVLHPGGFSIHIMPTPAWRLWSFATGFPTALIALGRIPHLAFRRPDGLSLRAAIMPYLKMAVAAVLPLGHGTSVEGVSELWTFSAAAWRRKFARHGFDVIAEYPIRLFYTGHMLMGPRLSFEAREQLSRILGSGTRIYVVRSCQSEQKLSS